MGPTASGPIAYAPGPLRSELEEFLVYSNGPDLAPSPGLPGWLAGAKQIGTDLFYVSQEQYRGFYTVSAEQLKCICLIEAYVLGVS